MTGGLEPDIGWDAPALVVSAAAGTAREKRRWKTPQDRRSPRRLLAPVSIALFGVPHQSSTRLVESDLKLETLKGRNTAIVERCSQFAWRTIARVERKNQPFGVTSCLSQRVLQTGASPGNLLPEIRCNIYE